jgi:hypothetical protein
MMKTYKLYKEWWIETQAPSLVPSLYWGETSEEAFKYHIKNLGVYGLMEKLLEWEENENRT